MKKKTPIDNIFNFITNQRLLQAHNNFCFTEMVPYTPIEILSPADLLVKVISSTFKKQNKKEAPLAESHVFVNLKSRLFGSAWARDMYFKTLKLKSHLMMLESKVD